MADLSVARNAASGPVSLGWDESLELMAANHNRIISDRAGLQQFSIVKAFQYTFPPSHKGVIAQ